MAEQPANNIKASDMASLLGQSSTNITVSALCGASNINKWSWYRPRPIQVNSTTKLVELGSISNNYKLGDFRRYDHTAAAPTLPNNFTKNWGPGGTSISLTYFINIERLNVKELVPSTTMYWTIDYYLSSTNRSGQTSRQERNTHLLSLSTESNIPSGHTNNQSQSPSSSTQQINDTINGSWWSTPTDTLYVDIYISDANSNELIRFDDSYMEVTVSENQNPYISQSGPSVNAPSGYTACFPVIMDSSSDSVWEDETQTFNSSSYSFYFCYVGLKSGSYYRLGSVSVDLDLVIANNTSANVNPLFNGTLPTAGSSSNQFVSGSLGGSQTWGYNDVGELTNQGTINWSGFTEYQL